MRLMKQRHNKSCGPTAVINLTRMLGYRKFSYKQVRDRIELLPTGTNSNLITPELRRLIGARYTILHRRRGRVRDLIEHLDSGYSAIFLFVTQGQRAHYVAVGPRTNGYYPIANDVPVFDQDTITMRRADTLRYYGRGRKAYGSVNYPYYWLVKPRKATVRR